MVCGYPMTVNGYPGNGYYLLRLETDGNVDDNYPMRSAPGANVYGVWTYPATDPNYPDQVRLFGAIPRFRPTPSRGSHAAPGRDGTTVLESLGDEIVNGPILWYDLGRATQSHHFRVLHQGL